MSISQCFFCCAPLTLPCRRIKTPAFLFGWAAHQNSRICGILLGCAPLTLAKGVRTKVTHLRDLFRPDSRNFPRHREAGFGDVRRIFAFYPAQICAVQISGVIIEKSRRSCCLSRSPGPVTSFHLEKFHGTESKQTEHIGAFGALRGFSQVIDLRSSTKQNACAILI